MIKGIKELSVLAKGNRELLTKIGFDFNLLDLAEKKSNELARKKAAASWERKDFLKAKKIRDQAFTHLKEAVDYISEFGKFVFRRNHERLKGYRSNYLRKIRLKSTRKKNELELEPGYVPIIVEE